MENIKFVTGNLNKVREARDIIGFEIVHSDMDLDEIQTCDLRMAATAKVNQAWKIFQSPVMVEDSGLVCSAWNGLPGALVKWFEKSVGCDGILRMLSGFGNREAFAICMVAVHDGNQVRVAEGRVLSENTASATNTADGFAGAAGAIGAVEGADITLDKSTLSENTATADAAGVAAATGGIGLANDVPLSLTKSEVEENKATAGGPGFAIANGAIGMPAGNLVTLTKSDVEENEAESSLFAIGGIDNSGGTLMLEDSDVEENRATSTGAGGVAVGGISTGLGGIAETTLTESEVEENVASAPAGTATGGLHNFPLGISMLVDDSEVQDNEPINCNFVDPACE